ncbi:unnamed protein product [Adineta ricciae]|uniref:Methenyltetrahydrofolate cyclohydrolase n=1 Tax=Adineta ricciae TaxID=249248 RepID=A0A813YFT2_ADIRI|nr:unnamed protein product [Adineta ricciae]
MPDRNSATHDRWRAGSNNWFEDTAQTVHQKNNNILYGKPIARRILNECQNECAEFVNKYQCRPRLVTVLVGGNESSKLYVRNKQRIAEHALTFKQSPPPLVTIPVVAAVREMLLEIGEPLQGKDVVVIGRSKYVGTPLALMLSQSSTTAKNSLVSGATVTICHRHTHLSNLTWYCKNADVIVSAVGRPKLITQRMVKKDAIVIDVGISKSWTDKAVAQNKQFVGDVDFHDVQRVARWITPVPGGVGQVTIACLISNLLRLARHRRQ